MIDYEQIAEDLITLALAAAALAGLALPDIVLEYL